MNANEALGTQLDKLLNMGTNLHDVLLPESTDIDTDEWDGDTRTTRFYTNWAQGRGHLQVWTERVNGDFAHIEQQTDLTPVKVTISLN